MCWMRNDVGRCRNHDAIDGSRAYLSHDRPLRSVTYDISSSPLALLGSNISNEHILLIQRSNLASRVTMRSSYLFYGLALLGTEAFAAPNLECKYTWNAGDTAWGNSMTFRIWGNNIGDKVSGDAFCNGVYDNISCPIIWDWACQEWGDRGIYIRATIFQSCNAGDINHGWWEATKNEFGAVDCREE